MFAVAPVGIAQIINHVGIVDTEKCDFLCSFVQFMGCPVNITDSDVTVFGFIRYKRIKAPVTVAVVFVMFPVD